MPSQASRLSGRAHFVRQVARLVPHVLVVGLLTLGLGTQGSVLTDDLRDVAASGSDLYPIITANAPAIAGNDETFTVKIRNAGAVAAIATITVTLQLFGAAKGGYTASGTGWTCPQDSGTCTSEVDAAGLDGLPNLTVTVPTSPDLSAAGYVRLQADVTTPSDAVTANNVAATQSAIVDGKDYDLALAISPNGLAKAGGNAPFKVTVRNLGSAAAPGPIRVAYSVTGTAASTPTPSGSGWTCPAGAGECTLSGALAAGGSAAALNLAVPITNDLQSGSYVSASAQIVGAPDAYRANDSGSATSPLVRSSGADLAVATSTMGPAVTGGSAKFRVRIHNQGGAVATGPIRVRLSSSGAIASSTLTETGSGWSCPGDGTECTSTGSVAPGADMADLVVSVPVSQDPSSPGTVGLSTGIINSSTENVHGNDSATASTPVIRSQADDLALAVSANGPAANGGSAAFTVKVRNLGGSSASGPVRVRVSPAGQIAGSAITGSGTGWGCPGEGTECVYSNDVAAGEALPDLTLSVPVSDNASQPGVATMSASFLTGQGLAGNDAASSTVPLRGAVAHDLAAYVTQMQPTAAGATGTATIRVVNVGAQSTGGRTVVTTYGLPPGSSVAGTDWTCASGGQCDYVGTITPSAVASDLVVTMPTDQVTTDLAPSVSVNVRNSADTNAQNDSARAAFGVGGLPSDLVVSVEGPATIAYGGVASFTARVRNAGSATSDRKVVVRLSGPTGATAFGSGWVCTRALVCDSATTPASGQQLPDLTVLAPAAKDDTPGQISVSASVESERDGVRSNNTSHSTTSSGIAPVDLSVLVQAPGPAGVGEGLTATATVSNTGFATATGVVSVALSSPLEGTTASGSGWSCTSDLTCSTTTDVPAGSSLPPVTLTAPLRTIDPEDAIQAHASLSSAADLYRSNNSSTASVGTGGAAVDLSTDLAVTGAFKSGSVSHVAAVVRNTGSTATSKPLTMTLSSPYPGAVAAGDGWVCNSDLACEYDDPIIAGGQAPTVDLEVRTPINSASTRAGVYADLSSPEDQHSRSRSSSATVPVVNVEGPAALAIDLRRTDSSGPILDQSALQFQLTVVNQSAVDVAAPTVVLNPSFGLTAVNPVGSGWVCTGLSCTYSVGLAPAEQAVLNVGGALSSSSVSRVFLSATASTADSALTKVSQTLPLIVAGRGVDLAPVVIAPTAAVAGSEAKFRIGTRNVGGNDATRPTEVRLTLNGPLAGAFSASGFGWRCPVGTNRCVTNATAPAQRSLPDLIITVPVDAEASSDEVRLTANVDNDLDVVPEDDTSSGSVPVIGSSVADLAVAVSPTTPTFSGGAGSFDVTVRNVGGGIRPGPVHVKLTTYPGDSSDMAATGNGWRCPTDEHECVYTDDVAAGATLPALTVMTSQYPNLLDYGYNQLSAQVVGPADGVAANDRAYASAPVVGADSDLAVSASPVGTATAAGDATFKVQLNNLGAAATDQPVHLSLSSSGLLTSGEVTATGAGWTCPANAQECVYSPTIGARTAAADLVLSMPVQDGISASSADYVSLSVNVADDDNIIGNNSASARIAVTPRTGADLAVAIGANEPARHGSDNVFKVRVRNVGYDVAHGPVRVRLNAGGYWDGGDLTGTGSGWTCPGDGRECTYTGALAAGASAPDLFVSLRSGDDPGASFRNAITLSAHLDADDDAMPDNDGASATQPLVRSTLPVELSVDLTADAPARRGTVAEFTATVRNTGTQDAAGPVTVDLGAPTPGSTATGSGWTCTSMTCVRPESVTAGGTLPPIIVHQPTASAGPAGAVPLSAVVSADSDTAGARFSYSATTVGGIGADLTTLLTAPAPQQTGSGAQTFVAQVLNAGYDPSSGPVTVQWSPGFTGASAAGPGWICSSQLTCTHQSSIAPGVKLPDLTLTVPVPKQDGFTVDAVSVDVSGGGDTVTTDNVASASAAVGGVPVDLSVRMTAPAPTHVGDALTYSAIVSNTGSSASTGTVTVSLSSPYSFATASGTEWECSSQLVCDYTGGHVPAGAHLPPIDLQVTPPSADSAGSASATASVSNASDLNLRNNSAAATTGSGGIASDLIVQVSGETALVAGQTSTAVARVRNVGSSGADGTVTVILSAPYNPVVTGEGWVCSSQLICEHDGPVEPGASLPDLQLTIAVPPDASATTTAIGASVANASDQNTRNNNDTTTLPVVRLLGSGSVGSAYVALQTTSSEAYAGGQATLQLQLNGAAPIAGAPATVTLALPAGLTYVSGSASGIGTPTGPADAPSWQLTMPSEGTTLNASVKVAIATTVVDGPVTMTASLAGADDVVETVAASFRVVTPQLISANPKSVGQAKSVSVSFNGNQLQPTFRYELVDGATTLSATGSHGAPGNVVGSFDTSTAPLGTYDAKVTTPGGRILTLPDAIKVVSARPDDLDVSLQGPSRVRINSPGIYYATVTNSGNVDAYDVPVVLTVPTGADVTSTDTAGKAVMAAAVDQITAPNPGPGQVSPEDAAEIKDYIASMQSTGKPDPSKPQQYIMATVPYLPPGASATAKFTVTPRQLVTAPVTASVPIDTAHYVATQQATSFDRRVTLPTAGKTSLDDALADIDCSGAYAEFCAVSRSYVKGLKEADRIARDNACVSFSWVPLVNGDCSVTNPITLLSPQKVIEHLLVKKFPKLGTLKKGYDVFSWVKGLFDDLIGAADIIEDGQDVALGVASTDPNEIVGVAGAGTPRWIRPDTDLEYTIKFENIAAATAAAQRVTVESLLPDGVDPTTIRVLSAEVGGTEIPITDGFEHGARISAGSATLEPGRPVLFDASVNTATGTLSAHFQGPPDLEDPFTPTPYTDFLPPNVENGEGEGSLRIVAKPKAAIVNGTELSTKAAITFDDHVGGPTINTNTWSNTIDSTAPNATLASLPATVSGTAHLSWTFQDTGSGGAGAAVYRKVDDGGFALAKVFTPGTSLDVPVTTGHTYQFAIVPIDGARNSGAQTAATMTTAVAPPIVVDPSTGDSQTALMNTRAPTIKGLARTGSTLTVDNGAWTPTPTTYTYQWSVGGLPIATATASTFVVPAAAVGRAVQVAVTAVRSGSTSSTITTSPVTASPGVLTLTAAPKVAGTAKAGKRLTIKAGATKPTATKATYQWLRNGKAIRKATKSSYKLAKADKGKKVTVRVVYGRTGYTSVAATAKPKKVG